MCIWVKTLVYICHADAEKCIFTRTILSQTPQPTPQMAYDAGRISAVPQRAETAEKVGCLSTFWKDEWQILSLTSRKNPTNALAGRNTEHLGARVCVGMGIWSGGASMQFTVDQFWNQPIMCYPCQAFVLFMGHMQTVQTQIRCHKILRLIRFTAVCLQYNLLKIEWNETYHSITIDWSGKGGKLYSA